MGRDKAFVNFAGKGMAERALTTAREAFPTGRVTFVAGNAVQFGVEAIRTGVPFIFDLIEDRGPLGGLHAALSHAQTNWIFVLACDYPFITGELMRLLAELVTDEFGAVIPEQTDGRLQPLCTMYRTAVARTVVEDAIQMPRVPPPLHEIVRQLDPRIVKPGEYSHLAGAETFFVNINSHDDLEKAKKINANLHAQK
jgi:molybdopterin-guanine dinucleotide biosynthesis protein A